MARTADGHNENTGHWQSPFLACLAKNPNVTKAAKAAGVSRTIAYRERAENAEFAEQWKEAWKLGLMVLEEEAMRRAMKSSDVLLIFMLKSHLPETYRETVRSEISGKDGGEVIVKVLRNVSMDDL